MARITGGITGVSFPTTVQNLGTNLPIVYSQDIQGGLTSVDDRAGLLAIPAQRIQPGMIVYQIDNNSYYRFVQGSLTRNSADSTFDAAITASNWEEIQFDVDSITVASGDVDPVPRTGTPVGPSNPANPANPHEGDLYINHQGNALWYYVEGTINMWVSSQGITEATGDGRYTRYDAAQTLTPTQQTQVRDNIGAGDIDTADVAITLNASNVPTVNSDTTAAAIRTALDVHDTGNVAITPFQHSTPYVINDLVADDGEIYRRVTDGISSAVNAPADDRGNWVSENSIAVALRFSSESFDNVQITADAANENTFIFTTPSNAQAVALRERILREHFGFPANQGTISAGSPLPIPADTTITAEPDSISTSGSQTLDSTVPTGETFAIRINGLTETGNEPLAAITSDTIMIQRNAERDNINLLTTETILRPGETSGILQRLNISGTDRELLLSVDDTVARTGDIPQFQTGDVSGTIENYGTSSTNPLFRVRQDSLGQSEFDKEGGRAVPGAIMGVAADGDQVTYFPSNTNRIARLTPLDSDFDIAAQRYYTRDSWRGVVNTESSNISERSTHNTSAFPLVSTDQGSPSAVLSTHLSTEMINELNALNDRNTGTALEYAAGTTYGIRPLHDDGTAQDRHTVWHRTFVNPSNSDTEFRISVDYGFQFSAYTGRDTGIYSSVASLDVRQPSDGPTTTITFTEWIARVNALLQMSTFQSGSSTINNQFAGVYNLTVTNATARQATVVLTSTYIGQLTGTRDPVFDPVTIIPNPSTSAPRPNDPAFRLVQGGHRTASGTLTPTIWQDYTENDETIVAPGGTATFTVAGNLTNPNDVIVTTDGNAQIRNTDYVVSVAGNSITFREANPGGGFRDRNIPNGVRVRIIYSTSVDLANGQYLLFQPTGIVGGSSTGDIESARWLNDGIGLTRQGNIATYERGLIAFEITEFNNTSVDDNRLTANINHISSTDTGIRRLLTRVPISGGSTGDIASFIEAEHDRYILIAGSADDNTGVYVHVLNIDVDNGTYIELDMDHWISTTADGTILYRPSNITFNQEIVNDYDLYRLNFLGNGDVTKDGNTTQIIARRSNFLNLQVDGIDQTSINAVVNSSDRVEAFTINDGSLPSGQFGTHQLEAYTRAQTDDRIERVISRVHTSGTTHNVALGLRDVSTPNANPGYTADPTPATFDFTLGAQPGMEGISSTDRDVLRSTQDSPATQPFVRYEVPNHTQVTGVEVGSVFMTARDSQTPPQVITGRGQVDGTNREFILTQEIANVTEVRRVTVNGVGVPFTSSLGNEAVVTLTTAPAVDTTVDIRYVTDRSYNDGIVNDSAAISISSIEDGLSPDETIVTLSAARPASLIAGSTVLLNTGNEFNRVTSLVLEVRDIGNPLTGFQFIVRRLTPEEGERFLADPLVPTSENGTVQVRTFEFDTFDQTGTVLTDTFWSIPRVNFRVTTTEGDPNIVGSNIFPQGGTYVIELTINNILYHGVGGISASFGGGLFISPGAATWSPSVPPVPSMWSAADRRQRIYIYNASTDTSELFYHFAPTTSTVNTNANWTAGRYTVDLTTLYSGSNEVLGDSALPVTRWVFPVQNSFEVGYFSNRISLQGLERFAPIRDVDSGEYVLNFTNAVGGGDPTIFWRGFYRTDLTIPVFMIRQVDTSTDNIQTMWGGWDGNIDSGAELTQSTVLPSGDNIRASQFILLTQAYAEGAATFQPGLWHRNTQDDGWRQITFSNTLPAITTSNN